PSAAATTSNPAKRSDVVSSSRILGSSSTTRSRACVCDMPPVCVVTLDVSWEDGGSRGRVSPRDSAAARTRCPSADASHRPPRPAAAHRAGPVGQTGCWPSRNASLRVLGRSRRALRDGPLICGTDTTCLVPTGSRAAGYLHHSVGLTRRRGVKIVDEGDAGEQLAEFLVANRLA